LPTKGKEEENKFTFDDVIRSTIRKKMKKELEEHEGKGILYELLPGSFSLGDLYTELGENLFVN